MEHEARVKLSRRLAGVVTALLALAGGCDSQKATQGAACSRVSDCAAGLTCGYEVVTGCSAHGMCVPVTPQPGQAACGALSIYCGCDGVTTVTSGCNFFPAFAPAPVMSGVASCQQVDAGPGTDAGSACSGWGETCSKPCCDGLVCMPSTSSALPSVCVKP